MLQSMYYNKGETDSLTYFMPTPIVPHTMTMCCVKVPISASLQSLLQFPWLDCMWATVFSSTIRAPLCSDLHSCIESSIKGVYNITALT